MTFNEQVALALIDKGFLALVLLAAGFLFNWLLQAKKARDEAVHALAPDRAKSYQALWAILGNVPASSDQSIPPDVRTELDSSLTGWYHGQSGALFLSWRAAKRFLSALDVTRDPQASDAALRDAVSALRTQLKRDCGIYSLFEARGQLPRPRPGVTPPNQALHLTHPAKSLRNPCEIPAKSLRFYRTTWVSDRVS